MKCLILIPALLSVAVSEPQTAEFSAGQTMAVSKERADQLAEISRTTILAFEKKFKPVTKKGLVYTTDAAKVEGGQSILASKDFAWKLPWFEDASKIFRSAVEEQVRKQLQGQPESVIQSAIDKALASQPKGSAVSKGGDIALGHEIGHMLLISTYWPGHLDRPADQERSGGGHYGGPASDWLDEAAAIAMEGDALTESRRKQFAKIVHGPDKTLVWSLAELVTMKHPALSTKMMEDVKPKDGVAVKRLDSNDPTVKRQGVFYAQIRNLIDFLETKTKNPKVLGEIAENEAAGKGFEDWLKANAAKYTLPANLSALEKEWKVAWPAPSTESATKA